jgi:hypothetical protein
MRTIVLAALLGMVGSAMQSALAQHEVRCEASIGHVQPTVADVAQAQSAKGDRSASDIQADEAIQKSENELRNKLIICRGC